MLYLLLALFFSTCIFLTFKYFGKFNINILPALSTNYLVASALGFFNSEFHLTPIFLWDQPWFLFAVIVGVSFIFTFVIFAVSTQRVGVAMTVVSSKMSVVLSVAAGFILLSEAYSFLKIAGIILALSAFYLTNKGRGEVNVERKYLFLPFLIFFGSGVNDIGMKLSGVYFPERDEIQFLTVVFFTAFLIGSFILLYRISFRNMRFRFRDFAAGLFLGIVNWYSTYFFIKGLFVLPISLFIPVFNAAIVLIAAVLGYFMFGEKLSVANRTGIVLAIVSIAIIAFS